MLENLCDSIKRKAISQLFSRVFTLIATKKSDTTADGTYNMKLVPAFFLLGFTIIHLIHVIAVPRIPSDDLETIRARRMVALSRFHKSKEYAPVSNSPTQRTDLKAYLRNYAKLAFIKSEKFLTSVRSFVQSRASQIHETVLSSEAFAHDLLILKALSYAETEHQKRKGKADSHISEVANLKQIAAHERQRSNLSPELIYESAGSTFNTLQETAKHFVSKVHQVVVNVAARPFVPFFAKREFQGRTRGPPFTEHLTIGLLPATAPQPSPEPEQQPQEGVLLISSTYLPIPSAEPSIDTVEQSPEASPVSSVTEGLKKIPWTHAVIVSATPKPTGFQDSDYFPVTVATLRRLARFVSTN